MYQLPLTKDVLIPYNHYSEIARAISKSSLRLSGVIVLPGKKEHEISRKEMASMATQTKLFSITRLRNNSTCYGHAMPFDLVKLCIMGGTSNNLSGPIFVFAQGRSMPISRGSPPIP